MEPTPSTRIDRAQPGVAPLDCNGRALLPRHLFHLSTPDLDLVVCQCQHPHWPSPAAPPEKRKGRSHGPICFLPTPEPRSPSISLLVTTSHPTSGRILPIQFTQKQSLVLRPPIPPTARGPNGVVSFHLRNLATRRSRRVSPLTSAALLNVILRSPGDKGLHGLCIIGNGKYFKP